MNLTDYLFRVCQDQSLTMNHSLFRGGRGAGKKIAEGIPAYKLIYHNNFFNNCHRLLAIIIFKCSSHFRIQLYQYVKLKFDKHVITIKKIYIFLFQNLMRNTMAGNIFKRYFQYFTSKKKHFLKPIVHCVCNQFK